MHGTAVWVRASKLAMKRYTLLLSALFVLGSVGIPFLGPLTVHAEPIPASPTATPAQQAALTASVGGVAANSPTPNNIGGPQADSDVNKVMMWIMSIFAWFLGVAAIILDYSVYYTVVKMGDYIHNLSAVATVWRTLRDIGNIVLIFGFVAMGIETIINTDFYGNVSKRLPMLLIVAVLLNFSLFFTEAIIDVGNLFATQFYSQIFDGKNIPPPSAVFQAGAAQESISNAILQQLHLTQLYGDAIQNKAAFTGQLFIGVLGCILFIIASFVMLSLAFILIARFITLIFLIIVAPIGFAGLIVPKLENTAKQWWNMLVKQTLTAPILMLMLYIALSVILSQNFLPGFGITAQQGASFTGFLTNSAPGFGGFGSIILSFIVAMGLLLGVTVLAKMMSAVGAGAATKWAGALSFGAVAFGARSTVGRLSTHGAQAFKNTKAARIPVLGRTVSGALNKGASGSFDIRGIKSLKSIPGGGLNAGDAQKGGFKKSEEEAVKARVKYASSLGKTKEEQEKLDAVPTKEALEKTAKDKREEMADKHSKDAQSLETAHRSALTPLTQAVDSAQAQQAAAEIAYRANANLANKSAFEGAQRKVQEARNAQAALVEEHRVQMQAQANSQREALKGLAVDATDAAKKAEEERKKLSNAPQTDYANNILKGWGGKLSTNSAASKIILKEATKDKKDKDTDAMLAALKKIGEEDKKEEKKSE